MNITQTKTVIKKAVTNKRPVYIHGGAGIGKSDGVRQAAEELGHNLIDVRLSQLDPVDLRGIPSIQDGHAVFAIPSWLPNEEKHGKKGILFLDEINGAPMSVQAGAYQLILDRKLGDYTLPEGWTVIAAGNRSQDKGVTHRIAAPLANRFSHAYVNVDIDDWSIWAGQNGIDPMIIGFLNWKPEYLHHFDPKSKEEAFASPRTWASSSDIITWGLPEYEETQLLAGTIGEGISLEFAGFRSVASSLPSLESIIDDPAGAMRPERTDALYALCTGLASKANKDNFPAIVQYSERLPEEFAVLLIKSAVDPDLARFKQLQDDGKAQQAAKIMIDSVASTVSFIDWTKRHSSVVFATTV